MRPQDLGPDVADFRPLTRGEPTLYLGRDNFVGWELRGSQLSGFQNYTPLGAHLGERASKSEGDRPAVDVDSLDPGALDSFRYLVAPRTAYASVPPPNLRTVRRSRWHVLWERRGKTSLVGSWPRARVQVRCWTAAGRRCGGWPPGPASHTSGRDRWSAP